MKTYWLVVLFILAAACEKERQPEREPAAKSSTVLVVLGTVQDGGSPHIACTKECCRPLFTNPDIKRQVVSLGVIDYENEKSYLFEATPDFPRQLKTLRRHATFSAKETPDGIFLTHAHIGHYSGLMYLGREAMGADSVPVYAMPRMKRFLEQNGPWDQLVGLGNIVPRPLHDGRKVGLTPQLTVTPFTVPHRDEYSETVGFTIRGPHKKALFIPDIDKWQKWSTDINEAIRGVDYAFVDATFFDGEEINHRDISEIPHPFVIESMALFKKLSAAEKNKVYFIHFNHTNPLLREQSKQRQAVVSAGFHIAAPGQIFPL